MKQCLVHYNDFHEHMIESEIVSIHMNLYFSLQLSCCLTQQQHDLLETVCGTNDVLQYQVIPYRLLFDGFQM